MRLGLVAAVVFMVLGMGLLYGAAENRPLIDSDVEQSMEVMQSATKVTQESGWGGFITLLAAPFRYFDSIVTMAWKTFDNSLWDSGQWVLVPYIFVSPVIIVLFLGFIMLLIGIFQKNV